MKLQLRRQKTGLRMGTAVDLHDLLEFVFLSMKTQGMATLTQFRILLEHGYL